MIEVLTWVSVYIMSLYVNEKMQVAGSLVMWNVCGDFNDVACTKKLNFDFEWNLHSTCKVSTTVFVFLIKSFLYFVFYLYIYADIIFIVLLLVLRARHTVINRKHKMTFFPFKNLKRKHMLWIKIRLNNDLLYWS